MFHCHVSFPDCTFLLKWSVANYPGNTWKHQEAGHWWIVRWKFRWFLKSLEMQNLWQKRSTSHNESTTIDCKDCLQNVWNSGHVSHISKQTRVPFERRLAEMPWKFVKREREPKENRTKRVNPAFLQFSSFVLDSEVWRFRLVFRYSILEFLIYCSPS